MQAMTKSLYQWMVSQPKYVNSFLNRFKLRARMLAKVMLRLFRRKICSTHLSSVIFC